ncbi:Trk system potassium transporter TrkA [Conexibacter arvalis]|uniref:Trk system potassium uptake protein TrkA n=1 Tax=Conexibacter arvalis TaxID=912552 RepID=A0A840IHA4_9ACTN|nr:Trk system potassium transporter TrkA [Conexibacter arvalis]MBB4663611.1 trk system potassium uptake protein TrkA [Conexibacter arvalis]
MRIIVLGAGHVGMAVTAALFEEHELTVVDRDPARLVALANLYDVITVEGDGASQGTLEEAGVAEADLMIASTAYAEVNLVAAMFVRGLASRAQTLVRTTDPGHIAAWRAGVLDVDFIVSSELETARAVLDAVAVPGARATDVFADGRVTIAEFDVLPERAGGPLVGVPLAQAPLPPESRVALIVRDDRLVLPSGGATLEVGDRVIVMASPQAAVAWSAQLVPEARPVREATVFGAGGAGIAIARKLLHRGVRVRIADEDAARARAAAAALPEARVFHAGSRDRDFLREERIGASDVAVVALEHDPETLFAAVVAQAEGVATTLAVVDDPAAATAFEQAGVDVTVDPRAATAEELVRFAHDPRLHQIALLDDDRFEVLDVRVRSDSALAGRRIAEMPRTGSTIGAIVRDGTAIFPHGSDELRAGDRAIVLVDPARATLVERTL